jgi:hypothetical protein
MSEYRFAMAYLRFSPDCDWYVFSEQREGESEERLAVWHKDHKDGRPSYSETVIRKMLESGDYSSIPGYEPRHKQLLRHAFETWLSEQSSSET